MNAVNSTRTTFHSYEGPPSVGNVGTHEMPATREAPAVRLVSERALYRAVATAA